MFNLESFCHSLHGLTEGEIRSRCEERATYFKGLDRAARYNGRRGTREYDYRGYFESIERLEHYIFGDGSQKHLSKDEVKLFDEVIEHMLEN